MKKILIPSLALLLMSLASCTSDDDGSGVPIVTPGQPMQQPTAINLSGNLVEDLTLSANSAVTLSGALFIKEGATLNIEPGVTINAQAGGTDVFILVERGGKIEANGTASAPIRITSSSSSPTPGDWGGLIINGRAPISRQSGAPNEAATEVRNDFLFGGDNATDNSGTLNYVILEYTGARINGDAEHNGLTLNGVGSGTTITNIAIFDGDDDAIEWFGGTVNVTNLLVVNTRDDFFDATQGWTGTLSNAYGLREGDFSNVSGDPRGIETDGNLDGRSPSDVNQSNFTMENITIVNQADIELNDAIKVRRGATANITNALVVDQSTGTNGFSDFVDLADGRGNGNASSSVNVSGVGVDIADIQLGDAPATSVVVPTTQNTGADTNVFGWTNYNFPSL